MPQFLARALGLTCLLLPLPLWAAPPASVRLDTSPEAPYQQLVDGQLGGLAVEVLECIFARLEQPHRIELTSWQRAKLNVRLRLSDGFFSAAPDPQSEPFAQLSAPLLIEKWYWYARDAQNLNRQPWSEQTRIGAVLGSNSLAWLELRGIEVQQKVARHEQLIKLLQRGRIDLVLADQAVMSDALAQDPAQPPLQQRFARYSPLGVYFARDFLDSHPGFLAAFNRQLEHCAQPGTPLTADEQRYLQQLARHHLARWGEHPSLRQALATAAAMDATQLLQHDQQWMAARAGGSLTLLAEQILAQPGSQYLRQVQQRYAPLFAELFVSDQQGLVVAMSQPTSDYWQGDEAKFLQSRDLQPGQLLIEGVRYDDSSQRFLAQLHAPLFDAEGVRLGTLTFGMDIEAVFAAAGP